MKIYVNKISDRSSGDSCKQLVWGGKGKPVTQLTVLRGANMARDKMLPRIRKTWQDTMPNSQIKQGQTVHMLQIATFWDIYSISLPIYIYIYIYIYIHIYICSTLTFFYNSVIEDAMPEKALNMPSLKKFKTKIFIFEYFPKIPSELNSTHPFYPILIPNTSYVKIFILS